LSPRFYSTPPRDGILEFDFLIDPPNHQVLDIALTETAQIVVGQPSWFKSVRICDASGEANLAAATRNAKLVAPHKPVPNPSVRPSKVIINNEIASYDDSFQPTGNTSIGWGGAHAEMKKLHHTLTLVVSGPDQNKIQNCINQSAAIGLIAAIVAAYATGGGALSEATSAFLTSLLNCLGDGFDARIADQSHWEYWWT
jgi:hypothetical protein